MIPKDLQDLLLDNLTQKEFGYSAFDLSKGSQKKIWSKCVFCLQPKKTVFASFIKCKALAHRVCRAQNQEYKEKRKQIFLEKYGVENPIQLRQSKEKRKQTNLKKYGHTNYLQSDKQEQKNKKQFSVSNVSQSDRIKNVKREKSIKKFGVETPLLREEVKDKVRKSKIEEYDIFCVKRIYPLHTREWWLKQTFHDDCRINPNRDLPDQWSQRIGLKLEIICSCGNIWTPSFNDFTSGRSKSCGCGHKNNGILRSQGAIQLGKLLEQLFPNQVSIEDNLGFLGQQRVDFAIPESKLVFEYDGEQHFRPVRFGGMSSKKAKKEFESIQKRDKKKEKLLEKNGWILIRIKYDQDIKQILFDALKGDLK